MLNTDQGTRERDARPANRYLLQRAKSTTPSENIHLLSWRLYTRPVQNDQGKTPAAASKDSTTKRAGHAKLRSSRAARMGNPEGIRAREHRQEGSNNRVEEAVAPRAG